MPCFTDPPTEREIESRLVASLLIFVYEKLNKKKEITDELTRGASSSFGNTSLLNNWTATLCGIIRSFDEDTLNKIVYNPRDRTSRRLADWWEDHQKIDEARERKERKQREDSEHEKLVDIFADLSIEEKRKLLELMNPEKVKEAMKDS